jgi:hypothetical protein
MPFGAPAEHSDILDKIDRLERRLDKLRRTIERIQTKQPRRGKPTDVRSTSTSIS